MSIPNCSNGAEATATRGCVLPRASLVLTITTAQKIFAISSSRDKISCHNFARLSAWCWRALHASGIFQIFHLSFRATARESSQQANFAPLDCHVTTFVAPRNDKMAGRPHPNEHSFRAHLLTVCAYSKCEPQGGEKANAELDEKVQATAPCCCEAGAQSAVI